MFLDAFVGLHDEVDTDLIRQDTVGISDTEPDLDTMSDASHGSLDQEFDDDDDDDDDDCHPILRPASNDGPEPEPGCADIDRDETSTSSTTELPEVIQKLRKQLLSSYSPPTYPPLSDARGRLLTLAEELSLQHYLAWVDSRGTVKAYTLHARVLQKAAATEILSLYMVRKLAMEVTGLISQMVDMCPKSCMAFTGESKDLQFCTYERRHGPCGQPRYDKKGHPRAQMIYTPITPVIQTLYMNRDMAEAMQYRDKHLQMALQKLEGKSSPTEYSDFSDSINHINQFRHSELFQQKTDTAITISGDGAQLTMKKQSDVWVLVVTILNLPPNMRSRAANIIIPLVIPGPSAPGDVESFIYVLYEELAKLSVGVWTKDAFSDKYFLLKVYLCGVLGDMLGSAKLSKMAGHMATYGCRFSKVKGARPSVDKGMISCYTIISFCLIILPYRC